MAAVRLDSPAGSVAFRRQQQQATPKMYNNGGWSTLGRSTGRQLQQQQQQPATTTTTTTPNSKTMTLRRHRSRSRSAALHCLSVPELSSDEEEEESVEGVEEEIEDDCYCYADWHQQESYQPALVVYGLNHHQWNSGGGGGRSSTPIKTATLRSALRSSINHYGD
ncbi:hypothetical protein DAPPUDRAFT_98486 [Daphnia pulex]|uniref:Uncharacterized protein n=1 Tax=Daphnia pulex TaxID=6669 RepID=E9G3V1_DAPPU|nr:hypothetical protein DAPPUDRAFT_98486 [Daphnia pulex]|eukprot:EFX85925.1 hypothetical protein DAPPUDRAFT_98486 [Daphnia pulex]